MAGWVAGAIVGGAALGALSSKRAADVSAGATERAAQTSADVQERLFERQAQLQEPWRQAGMQALNRLIPESMAYTPFSQRQFQADPGYAFRMQEGMKALDRQAAARGGLISGNALRAAQRFGQDLASQEYQNAFNRYQVERQARLNPLQSLAGVGQTSANALTGAAGQLGANLGQTYLGAGMAAGQNRASGYIGGANAITGALGTGMNYYTMQQLMNRLQPAAAPAPVVTSPGWVSGADLPGGG